MDLPQEGVTVFAIVVVVLVIIILVVAAYLKLKSDECNNLLDVQKYNRQNLEKIKEKNDSVYTNFPQTTTQSPNQISKPGEPRVFKADPDASTTKIKSTPPPMLPPKKIK